MNTEIKNPEVVAPEVKAAPAPIKKLAHTKEVFMVDIAGKTNAAIIEEIKAAGFVLGSKSLASLLDGSKTVAGDFEMIEVKFTPTSKADKKAVADAAKLAKATALADKKAAEVKPEEVKPEVKPEEVKPEEVKPEVKPAPKNKGKIELTPEQVKLAADVEKDIPTRETTPPIEKPARILNDVSHLLPPPGTYTPLLKGSVMARMFEMLVRNEGATKAELMKEFVWSAGGLAGIIHWEPKKKGYVLGSEKKDGVIHYDLRFQGGIQRVKPEELTYREKKAVAAVKTAEEKAAEKEAKDAKKAADKLAAESAKPVKETKPTEPKPVKAVKAAEAPPMGAANITKRVSAKKAAAQE